MKRNLVSGLVTAIALLVVTSVSASPILKITSLGDSCTLADGAALSVCVGAGSGSGDILGGTPGAVSGSFTVGVFTINVTTGVSKPELGSPSGPHMELSTVNKSSGAGTVTIEFTDDSFSGFGNAALTFGGVAGGSVVYSAYSDAGNGSFAQTTLLGTPGLLGPGAYGGSLVGGIIGQTSPYSLTQVVTFTHAGAHLSSGDHELALISGSTRTVPEPSILFLLGFGALGLGAMRRRLL